MKKIVLSLLALGFMASSCSIIAPITATNNPIGNKTGVSSNSCLFPITTTTIASAASAGKGFNIVSSGMCFNKNYGVIEAAKKGNIDRVATVDLKTTNYFFFTKYELIVTGE